MMRLVRLVTSILTGRSRLSNQPMTQALVLGAQALDLLTHRGEHLVQFLVREARGDVLRAVPIEGLNPYQGCALGTSCVVGTARVASSSGSALTSIIRKCPKILSRR